MGTCQHGAPPARDAALPREGVGRPAPAHQLAYKDAAPRALARSSLSLAALQMRRVPRRQQAVAGGDAAPAGGGHRLPGGHVGAVQRHGEEGWQGGSATASQRAQQRQRDRPGEERSFSRHPIFVKCLHLSNHRKPVDKASTRALPRPSPPPTHPPRTAWRPPQTPTASTCSRRATR